MTNPIERIPIPWPQRWELFRERVIPVLCLVATITACAWLWQYQSRVAPFALGEVHMERAAIASPHDGIVQPIDGSSDGSEPLFAKVHVGDVVARVKRTNAGGDLVEVTAAMDGKVTAIRARAGQFVRKGDPILEIASDASSYILCHLPDLGQTPPEAGAEVDIRQRGRGVGWVRTKIEAVGPGVEPTPTYEGIDMSRPDRGTPLRIAMPAGTTLKPGSLVEVRFAPPATKL